MSGRTNKGYLPDDSGSMRSRYARSGGSYRRPHRLSAVSGACAEGQKSGPAERNGNGPEGGRSIGDEEAEERRDRALAGKRLRRPFAIITESLP